MHHGNCRGAAVRAARLAFFAVLLGAFVARSAERPVRILSYNVQFLPGPAQLFNNRGDADYRARKIAERTEGCDIVGFCEVFEDAPRQRLFDELRSRWGQAFHAVAGPPPPTKGRYNGGLAVVSKFPIVASHHAVYEQISRVKDFGVFADEFAAKGVLHARVKTGPGDREHLDVFVTHMDSKDPRARRAQVDQLSAFVRQHADPRRPSVLLGDFNIRGNPEYRKDPNSDYRYLIARLEAAFPEGRVFDAWLVAGKGPEGTTDQSRPEGGRRIDYIFLAVPRTDEGLLRPASVRVERFLDPKTVALSDHSGVEGEFFLRLSGE